MTDQIQNPYASPEEVTEGEEWQRLPERQALMLTQAGLGWMLLGAWCWLAVLAVCWLIFLGVMVSSSARGAYHEPESLVWVLWVLAVLAPVAGLCSFPGTWRCSQGMGAGDEQGRANIRISAICGMIGFLLNTTLMLAMVGMVLWMVSFWHWYRYLEYVARKINRPDLAQRAFIMILVVLGWLGLGLATGAVLFLGILADTNVMQMLQVMLLVFFALPVVYLVLEIWVLRGLWREVEGMKNEE